MTRVLVAEVDPNDVTDDAFLLDVREPDEWAAGHAPDAVHVPMMEIPTRARELPAGRDIVVVCRVGARSAQVVAFLNQQGWGNVRNLRGGMYAWVAAGRPVVDGAGGAGEIV
jgi:rhodanese-related sulfurtransferase